MMQLPKPMPDDCKNCHGGGQIANDDDGTPWVFWESLPPESSLAMVFGLVQPVQCPKCGGSGKRV